MMPENGCRHNSDGSCTSSRSYRVYDKVGDECPFDESEYRQKCPVIRDEKEDRDDDFMRSVSAGVITASIASSIHIGSGGFGFGGGKFGGGGSGF